MSMVKAKKRMLEDAILSLSPGELVEVVLDKAVQELELAREADGTSLWEEQRTRLLACQRAVNLLLESLLPPDRQGADPQALEMAASLRALYLYVLDELVKASLERRLPPAEGAEKVLKDIALGWKQGVLGRA